MAPSITESPTALTQPADAVVAEVVFSLVAAVSAVVSGWAFPVAALVAVVAS